MKQDHFLIPFPWPQIKKIQLQYRSFNYVTFKNVSLVPGKNTKPTIEKPLPVPEPESKKSLYELVRKADIIPPPLYSFSPDKPAILTLAVIPNIDSTVQPAITKAQFQWYSKALISADRSSG